MLHSLGTCTQKIKRSQKHALQLQSRADNWIEAINEEVHYMKLIPLIIDAEIKNAIVEGNIDVSTTTLFSTDHTINVMRQAAHAYHVLYRGDLDEVVVKQTGESSLSGRRGIVTQYISSVGAKPGGYVVRIESRNVKYPTRFCGDKCFIESKHLEQQKFHPSSKRRLPLSHPVVIMYYDSNKEPHHISFSLERAIIDIINKSIPDGVVPQRSFVQPFILSREKQGHGNDTSSKSYDDITRWEYFTCNNSFGYKPECQQHKRKKTIVNQCPCHHSGTCPFGQYCGPCSSRPSGNNEKDLDSDSKSLPDAGFDMDIVFQPDARVFEVPFVTKNSIVPSAALYLNELNVTPGKHQVISEEVLMSRLVKCAKGTITNTDILSLFPHHNISGSIFNILVGW